MVMAESMVANKFGEGVKLFINLGKLLSLDGIDDGIDDGIEC
jgi:hypothetical protein